MSQEDMAAWHNFEMHPDLIDEPVTDKGANKGTSKPSAKANKPKTKANKRKAIEETIANVGVLDDSIATTVIEQKEDVVKEHICQYCSRACKSAIGLYSHEQACAKKQAEKKAAAPKIEKPEPAKDPFAVLGEFINTVKLTAEEAHNQAVEDQAFFAEIREKQDLIETIQDESMPALMAIPEAYRDEAMIETLNQTLAAAIGQLAVLKLDPRYKRGKTSAEEIALMNNMRHAQELAAEHNADLGANVQKRAQDWLDRENTRFERMLWGEIWVPTKYETDGAISYRIPEDDKNHFAISFMHDTMWKLNGILKRDLGDKWYKDWTPEDTRAVWNEVFDYQMSRYKFFESHDFSYVGKHAHVNDSGEMILGDNETFSETAHLPFAVWSTKLLNACISVQKQNKGYNLIDVLERHDFQGAKKQKPEILPGRFLSYVAEKVKAPRNQFEAEFERLGITETL